MTTQQVLPPEHELVRPSRRLVWTLVAVVFAMAALGYWRTGMPDYDTLAAKAVAEESAKAQAGALAANGLPDATQMAAMVEKLQAHLKGKPDDLQGWTMLGRVQGLLGKPELAVAAFGRAVALKADDARLLTDYAEALAMKNGRQLAGEPTQLLARALAIDPRQGKALALAGAAAYESKDYATAVRHWEALLGSSPPEAEFAAQLRASIADARQLAKLPAASGGGAASASTSATAPATATATATATAMPDSPPPSSPNKASVSGMVFLSPALAATANPEHTLFIVARAADGPRVPLAVLRKQVKDLPLNFTLDDSLAMAPNMKLSNFSKVIVTARISKSGQALPQAGDLTGQTSQVDVGATGLRVEIAEQVAK